MRKVNSMIIVGGGTAGLVVALTIRRTFPDLPIKLIESKNIGIIGVGEGTTFHWNHIVKYCQLNVGEMVAATDATYKIGIKFGNWNGDGKSYIHSLVTPLATNFDLLAYPYCFAKIIADGGSCEDMLSSYFLEDRVPAYFDALGDDLAYHFNTWKLNEYLHKICKERSIEFIEADLVSTKVNDNGIESVTDATGQTYSADFFVDSSGFSRLLSKELGSKWVDYGKYLPMNHAIAFPTETTEHLPVVTESNALSSGWNWRIPTYERYGNGYVFNDAYITADQAKAEVEQAYGYEINVAKDIKFSAGKIDKFWINNCVSVGLSGSFVEPLEATSIGFTALQAISLAAALPLWEANQYFAEKHYNKVFEESFNNIVDFVQLHYFTKRKDSAFWKDLDFTVTDFNKETLEMFKHRLPTREIFEFNPSRMFGARHWTMVMLGLDMFDRNSIKEELQKFVYAEEFAREFTKDLKDKEKQTSLISHREFLDRYRHITQTKIN